MIDYYNRKIDYLRISITDRCNLRCRYCMPEDGIKERSHSEILSYEQIVRIVHIASQCGIRKVRLTGGEPLVRKDISKLISSISSLPKINDVSLTTNGIAFSSMADELKAAGLNRINISLDTLNPEKFESITRRNKFYDVIQAIDKAITIGLAPVKINTVLMKGINDDEIFDFIDLTTKMPVHIRFIEFMPIGDLPFHQQTHFISSNEIKQKISLRLQMREIKKPQGSGPAENFIVNNAKGTIGFISAISNHFCSDCNRIRLTADGKLKSCLFSNEETNLNLALENNANDKILINLFRKAVLNKPDRHRIEDSKKMNTSLDMYQLGG